MIASDTGNGDHDRQPDVRISDSAGVQVGSGNVLNVHQHLAQVVHEVTWPVRVGPVVSPADGFQHRQVESLREPVRSGGRTVVLTQVLRGMGGVGKTQLAAGLAERVWRQREVDLLVWITARDRASIVYGFAEAAAATGISAESPEQAAGRMRDWLASTDKRWLVVLDDLSVPADLNDWWPPDNPAGVTVVTTRRRDTALTGQGRRLVDVGVFTPGEAQAYLASKFTTRSDLGDDLSGVASDLGFLPLALAQAAAFMLDLGIPCRQYRQRLVDRRRRLEHVVPEPGSLPDQHQATVNATWSLSIDAADRLPPVGLARPLLEICSMLDPNGIPHEVLATDAVRGWLSLDGDDDPGGVAAPELVSDAVAALHRLSLLEITSNLDGVLRGPLMRVHALVQRAVREGLPPERRDQVSIVAADVLLQAWPEVDNEPAYIQTLCANATSLTVNHPGPLWTSDSGGHPVLFHPGASLGQLGQVHAAVSHFHDLHHAAQERLGPDHPDTLVARDNLANWRGYAGDEAGAAAAYAELLDDELRVLGPDHPGTLTTRGNLAYWRGETGDAAGAAAAFAELLADRLRVLGPDHPNTLSTRRSLARWREEAIGRVDGSEST